MIVHKPHKITDNKWLNLFQVSWSNRNKEGSWIFTSRKESPQENKEVDAVVIVPFYDNRLVITREFRIPVNDYEYSFPAGLKNDNESIAECAKRELLEETGLNLTQIKLVSPVMYSSTGLSDESFVMVFCDCEGKISTEGLEASEELSIHLLDIEQIKELYKNYTVKHSCKLWPVLFLFANLGTLKCS